MGEGFLKNDVLSVEVSPLITLLFTGAGASQMSVNRELPGLFCVQVKPEDG